MCGREGGEVLIRVSLVFWVRLLLHLQLLKELRRAKDRILRSNRKGWVQRTSSRLTGRWLDGKW